jgi:hypothetical protein
MRTASRQQRQRAACLAPDNQNMTANSYPADQPRTSLPFHIAWPSCNILASAALPRDCSSSLVRWFASLTLQQQPQGWSPLH